MSEPTTRPLRWIAALAVGVLAVLAAISLLKPAAEPAPPAPPCPQGFVDRPGRRAALDARLSALEVGRGLVEDAEDRGLRYCFGQMDRPAISGRALLLSEEMPEPDQAARVGHLLHHAVHGSPFPEAIAADADCDAVIGEAVRREAVAYALEVELRAALDLEPTRYEFEPELRGTPRDGWADAVARYLRAHPDGAPNLDPLVSAYRQRCEIERAEAQ